MFQNNNPIDVRYAENSLALACLRGREAVVSNFHPILQALDVTEQQWRVIRISYEYDQILFAELCRLSCIHKVSMARIIQALSDRGWVLKERSGSDLRAYTVSLTPEGRRIADTAVIQMQDIYNDLFERYGKKKAELLIEMLKDLEKVRRAPSP